MTFPLAFHLFRSPPATDANPSEAYTDGVLINSALFQLCAAKQSVTFQNKMQRR